MSTAPIPLAVSQTASPARVGSREGCAANASEPPARLSSSSQRVELAEDGLSGGRRVRESDWGARRGGGSCDVLRPNAHQRFVVLELRDPLRVGGWLGAEMIDDVRLPLGVAFAVFPRADVEKLQRREVEEREHVCGTRQAGGVLDHHDVRAKVASDGGLEVAEAIPDVLRIEVSPRRSPALRDNGHVRYGRNRPEQDAAVLRANRVVIAKVLVPSEMKKAKGRSLPRPIRETDVTLSAGRFPNEEREHLVRRDLIERDGVHLSGRAR